MSKYSNFFYLNTFFFFLLSFLPSFVSAQSLRGSPTEAVSSEVDRNQNIAEACYIFVALCFMFALKGLGNPETASKGNASGMIGMGCAILVSVLSPTFATSSLIKCSICFVLASFIGISIALKAEMIMMPQLVAGFHAMVGLAAVMVAYARYFDNLEELMNASHLAETMIGVFFGAVTLTGSIVACGKLHGVIPSKPLMLPMRHLLNALIILSSIGLTVLFCNSEQGSYNGMCCILIETVISLFLGYHLVMSIGGADMPVVVSMLNSYSGWTTVAAGFMLDNNLLIIAGSLIGSSGAILSYIMCKGMNRSFVSVILGGFGVEEGHIVESTGTVVEIQTQLLASALVKAKHVVIVPGYGMAVARCQQNIASIAEALRSIGVRVIFGIHPVAGRLPGHMNVLLAEANVPYDIVHEMDKINDSFPSVDVSIVCGANDIVNPLAVEDLKSPIGGMPVLEVWKAKLCVVMKRSMATGYSGIDNPLFYKDNVRMYFGDAKVKSSELLTAIQTEIKSNATVSSTTNTNLSSSLLPNKVSVAPVVKKEYPTPSKTIGVLNEYLDNSEETRVALSPNLISKFREMGYSIVIEKNAGKMATFPDRYYAAEGCKIAETALEVYKLSDIIVRVGALPEKDIPKLRANQVVIAYLWPAFNPNILKLIAAQNVTALSMDAVPRITRAQKLDSLSSMANMAGYKAVIESFHYLPRFSKALTTAAGQVEPSRVFIIGAGVAGLSAIGTAKSLGAIVIANDTRPVVKEQVESMGAEFAEVPFKESGEGSGGYAKQMSDAFTVAQLGLYAKLCKEVDVVITTAQIPGKPAPKLITKEMVRSMRYGSVIVDLAAQQGGNCELTRINQIYTDVESGVTIIGLTNLATSMPAQASELYAANLGHLFKHMKDAKSFDNMLSSPDDVIAPVRCTFNGKVTWSLPAPPTAPAPTTTKSVAKTEKKCEPCKSNPIYDWIMFAINFSIIAVIFILLGSTSNLQMIQHFMAFSLSIIVGYLLVWSVVPSLHTPLMSVTNAISGIIVLGSLLQLSAGNYFAMGCAALGTFCASVNIFGGFAITHRMLKMFRK